MTDDSKTTPTPAPGLDLDAVERAELAMTLGEWRTVNRKSFTIDMNGENPERVEWVDFGHHPTDADLAGIVALRNAAPALIAEVRRLRAAIAEATSLLRSAGDLFVEIQATDGDDEHKAITDGAKLSAAIAAALEAL